MTDIDDLHKLSDLREKGAITQREFDKKKVKVLSGRSRSDQGSFKESLGLKKLWWQIPVVIVALVALGNSINRND